MTHEKRGRPDIHAQPAPCGFRRGRARKTEGKTESPPPARGASIPKMVLPMKTRITPACAGNTPRAGFARPEGRNHPRLRGEHLATAHPPNPKSESPPPARGTPEEAAPMRVVAGITPACAGNTLGKPHHTVISETASCVFPSLSILGAYAHARAQHMRTETMRRASDTPCPVRSLSHAPRRPSTTVRPWPGRRRGRRRRGRRREA